MQKIIPRWHRARDETESLHPTAASGVNTIWVSAGSTMNPGSASLRVFTYFDEETDSYPNLFFLPLSTHTF